MKIILLAGHRTTDHAALTSHIKKWSALNWEVVTVLAGAQADELLRHCPELATTELAFDTTPEPTLISNMSGGLHTTEEAALIFPVEIAFPNPTLVAFLKNEAGKAGRRTPYTFIQAVDPQGAPCHMGFPLVVTAKGNELFRSLDDLRSLTDPRLTYLQLPFNESVELASAHRNP